MEKRFTLPEATILKTKLWERCLAIQQKNVESAKNAMLEAQASANEQKGTMGDKFESFREQMQIDRDMHAKQYYSAIQVLREISRIDPSRQNTAAAAGALVQTDSQSFFLAASLGKMVIDGNEYFALSVVSPLGKAMVGKKNGETFSFRDRKYVILTIY